MDLQTAEYNSLDAAFTSRLAFRNRHQLHQCKLKLTLHTSKYLFSLHCANICEIIHISHYVFHIILIQLKKVLTIY